MKRRTLIDKIGRLGKLWKLLDYNFFHSNIVQELFSAHSFKNSSKLKIDSFFFVSGKYTRRRRRSRKKEKGKL